MTKGKKPFLKGKTAIDRKNLTRIFKFNEKGKLAYSPEFHQFLKGVKIPGCNTINDIVVYVYDLISNKTTKDMWKNPEVPFVDKKSGITIETDRLGSLKGDNNIMTRKLTYKDKSFFLKEIYMEDITDIVHGYNLVQNYIKNNLKGSSFEGFNFHAIKPLFAYNNSPKFRAYLLLDNYGKEDGMEYVPDIKNPVLKKKLSGVIEKLRKQMKEHFEVNKIEIGSYTDLDVKDFNAFYHFKSKTILLFDFLGLPKLRF